MAAKICTRPGCGPRVAQNLRDAVLFAKRIRLADELDRQPVRIRQRLRIGPNGIPQRLGELLAIVENADAVAIQVLRHPGRIAQGLQVATDDDAVVAVQYTIDLAGVLLIKRNNAHLATSLGTGC